MIKNIFSTKVFFFLFSLFLFFVFATFVYYKTNSSAPLTSEESTTHNIPADVYVAYVISEPQTKNQLPEVSVYLYGITSKTNRKIYTVALQNEFHNPLFRKFQNSILIDDAEPDRHIRIDLNGRILEKSIDEFLLSRYIHTLFSRSGQKNASLQFNQDLNGEAYLKIQDETGKEKSLPAGSESNEAGVLFPLHWSSDEGFLYTHHVRDTEGFIVGIEKWDIATLQKERIQPVDELQLVQYAFDASDNLYAVSLNELEFFGEKTPTRFYKVSPDNAVTIHELKQSEIDKLLNVDPSGRFVAYVSASQNGPYLWLYDIESGFEKQITDGYIIEWSDIPAWHEDKLLFLEQLPISETFPGQYSLKYYDASSQKNFEIRTSSKNVSPPQSRIEVIGWFVVE